MIVRTASGLLAEFNGHIDLENLSKELKDLLAYAEDLDDYATDAELAAETTARVGADTTLANADIALGTRITNNQSVWTDITDEYLFLLTTAAGSTTCIGTLNTAGANVTINTNNNSSVGAFEIYAADHAISGKTTKIRLRSKLLQNAVTPARNFVIGLNEVLTWGGAASQYPFIASVDAADVSNTHNTPAGPSRNPLTSGTISLPNDGHYCFTATASGAMAATSQCIITAKLQKSYV